MQENVCNYDVRVFNKKLSSEYSVRRSTDDKSSSCNILLFLILSQKPRTATPTNVIQKYWWSKLLKKYWKEKDRKALLIVSYISWICFLFKSLKLTGQFFFKMRPDISILNYVGIIQHFSNSFIKFKTFLVQRQCFSFCYLATKELVFSNKTNS